jgi:hypothetical protein
MKTPLSLLVLIALPAVASAFGITAWTYQEMQDKADLVAIAEVISSNDTSEKMKPDDLSPRNVIGVETRFKVNAILKGGKYVKEFVLHHYRMGKIPVTDFEWVDAGRSYGPAPFGRHECYLLFLSLEPDGRYAPVSGQGFSARASIVRLNSSNKYSHDYPTYSGPGYYTLPSGRVSLFPPSRN